MKAMTDVDKFKEALSCLPLDEIIERSFLAVSGLTSEGEGIKVDKKDDPNRHMGGLCQDRGR